MSDISPNVVILTRRELDEIKAAEYQRGVRRGMFEATNPDMRVAFNCVNWKDGVCDHCGAQHQGCEVHADYKCPYWSAKP